MIKKIVLLIFILAFISVKADILINKRTHTYFSGLSRQVLSGVIELQNNSMDPARVRIYLSDYFFYTQVRRNTPKPVACSDPMRTGLSFRHLK